MVCLLSAHPQLSCYFHHFKVTALLLVHFLFGFPCFVVCWLYLTACSLLSAPWIHPLAHWSVPLLKCVYMYLLNWNIVFLYFKSPADHQVGLVEHVLSFVLTELNLSFEFFPPKWDSSQWSHCLPGSDQHLILGPCSCSFLNNYMVVICGKILWGIPYLCAHASWVTQDYQVSSKFPRNFAFSLWCDSSHWREQERDWESTPRVSAGSVSRRKSVHECAHQQNLPSVVCL